MTEQIGREELCDGNAQVVETGAQGEAPSFLRREPGIAGDLGNDPRARLVLEVAQTWCGTVLEVRHLAQAGAPVRLDGPGAPFSVPDTLTGELVRWEGDGWIVDVQPGWTVRRTIGKGATAVLRADKAADGWSLPLTEGSAVSVDTGLVSFHLRVVPAGRKVAGKRGQVDYPFLGIASLCGFAAAMLGLLVATSPPPVEEGVVAVPDRFVELMLATPEPDPVVVRPTEPKKAASDDPGAKAKGEEGRVGRKEAKMKQARGSKTDQERRRLDREIAESAGAMGVLSDQGALAGVFGSGLRDDLMQGVGGMLGAKGVQVGSNGLGSRGGGLGGGGTAEGIGGLDLYGRGDGCRGCSTADVGLPPKTEGKLSIPTTPIIIGGLDKSLIDAVVKQHTNQIRYCYQRELTRSPNLAGKVKVRFVIAADGSVSRAAAANSSLGSAEVESCISKRFLQMRFPEVKGGGTVIVTYPFLFSPG